MSMITIIQVNPRLTSTFGPPTRDWGPKRLMEDMIQPSLSLSKPHIIPRCHYLFLKEARVAVYSITRNLGLNLGLIYRPI